MCWCKIHKRVKTLVGDVRQVTRILLEMTGYLLAIKRELKQIKFMLRKPGRITFTLTGDDPMLKFKLSIPEKTAADVVKGELSVKIGDADAFTLDTPVGPTDVTDDRFQGEDNAAVHAELVYVDDAGNRSTPSVLDAVLTDTIAPAQPGQLSLTVTEET